MTPPWLRGVRAAATFLTRVPVGGFPYRDDDWRWASAHFPLIGLAVGAIGALACWLALPVSPLVAGGLAVAATVLVTGGFHEDGLADSADALGGGFDRVRVLQILKDSRIGAFGGLAITLSILLRVALLAALAGRAPVALVVAHALSRVPPIWLMVHLPYATDDAAAKSRLITRAGPAQALVATGWGLAAGGAAVGLGGVAAAPVALAIAVCVGVTLIAGWRFTARVGGVTGDFLGATQQLCELAILFALATGAGAP